MSEETENPAQDLREVSSSWGNRLANCLMALAVLALMGAGVREFLIHNGKLTSDLNANGFAITNLPAGFIPDVGAAIGDFARTNGVLGGGPYVKKTSTSPSGQSMYGGFRIRGWLDTTGTVSATYGGPTLLEMRTPSAWMDCRSFNLGWATGGWTFDSEGFHRHLHGAVFEPFTNGPAIKFPEDAWETGGTLALRSDLAATDLSAASNYTDAVAGQFEDGARTAQYANNSGHAEYAVYLHSDDSANSFTATDLMVESTNAAKSVATPISNLVETVRAESALVYRLYQGSNVVAEVTNYNSSVHAPELKIMQLNESNEYITVWAETNGLARTLARAKEYADGATGAVVQAVAPRAWSKVTAGLGFDAPSNTTWLSTGRTVIAGGLEYEKHMTSGGAIWLLESNGMTADFHAQTNNTAFIDLSNADGTPIFRVEKTDSFLVGVHVDSVTVDGDALVCGVGVVAADHPLVRVKAQLESGEWAKEEDGIPASLATVTWSGTTGNWTCRIQNNTGGGTLFAQMEYFQEGGTKVVNTAPIDVPQGILCTDGIHKCRPVYSNGNITWEVVP